MVVRHKGKVAVEVVISLGTSAHLQTPRVVQLGWALIGINLVATIVKIKARVAEAVTDGGSKVVVVRISPVVMVCGVNKEVAAIVQTNVVVAVVMIITVARVATVITVVVVARRRAAITLERQARIRRAGGRAARAIKVVVKWVKAIRTVEVVVVVKAGVAAVVEEVVAALVQLVHLLASFRLKRMLT